MFVTAAITGYLFSSALAYCISTIAGSQLFFLTLSLIQLFPTYNEWTEGIVIGKMKVYLRAMMKSWSYTINSESQKEENKLNATQNLVSV